MLFPKCHGMRCRGYLTSREELYGGRRRRVCRATPQGRKTLAKVRDKVQELFGEFVEEEPTPIPKPKETRHEERKR